MSARVPATSGAEKLVPSDALNAVRIDRGCRNRGAGIRRRQDRIQARGTGCRVHAVAGRRADRDLGPEVGKADLGAGVAQSRHRDHSDAIRGRGYRMARPVSRRSDDRRTRREDFVDRLLIRSGARPVTAEAQVDHLRRIGIGRHPGDAQARSPAHAGDNVRIVAETLAEHAHGQHSDIAPDARHADAIVGERRDQTGDLRAVPGAVLGRICALIEWAADLRQLCLRHPVSRIGRIGVPTVAIVRDDGIADHVVARKEIAAVIHGQQIGVIEAHTCVDDRHDNVRRAGGHVPRGLDVDRRRDDVRRRAQVPLPDRRTVPWNTVGVQRIVRRGNDTPATVGHRVFHVALLREAPGQLLRRQPGGQDDLRVIGERRAADEGEPHPQAQRTRAGRRFLAGRQRRLAEQWRARLEFDDDPRTRPGRGCDGLGFEVERDR